MADLPSKIRWTAEHTKHIGLKINRNTDADIFEWLESVDNVAGYIKRLIREDIARHTDSTVIDRAFTDK